MLLLGIDVCISESKDSVANVGKLFSRGTIEVGLSEDEERSLKDPFLILAGSLNACQCLTLVSEMEAKCRGLSSRLVFFLS